MPPPAPDPDAYRLARDPAALAGRLASVSPEAAARPDHVRVVYAPGRVSLIGEHTDYNEGFVLPVAIDLGIAIALVPADDRRVEMTLTAGGETLGFDLGAIGARRGAWIDCVAGTAWALAERGAATRGFRGILASDLPQGSGLSSSAALELASSLALSGGELPALDRMTLARTAQRAENGYVGVNRPPVLHGLGPGPVHRRAGRRLASARPLVSGLLRASVRKFMVGYELLSEPQHDLAPEEAAGRLRDALV